MFFCDYVFDLMPQSKKTPIFFSLNFPLKPTLSFCLMHLILPTIEKWNI